ncbi:MAG: hypothetical protein JWO05_1583 [Gemmatimonadetes bacterium]|nr:hypothetical protein [Gemmatimonadota bacterium]
MSRYSMLLAGALLASGCASTPAIGGGGTGSAAGGAAGGAAQAQPAAAVLPWEVKTREHVDLWLHGYAMLTNDTALVPLFRRGYREEMLRRRTQFGVTTLLDVNRERLVSRLQSNPALVNGQFVALYFSNFDQVRQGTDLLLQLQGNIAQVQDPNSRALLAVLAGSFPTGADREWLRLFVASLEDERAKFYHDYWTGEQRVRLATIRSVDSLWQGQYRSRLQRYLNNTQLESGDFLLSLPLGGEGRTATFAKKQNAIAVTLPASQGAAIEAIYAFVHEAISAVAGPAITDNITPTEQRSGVGNQIAASAAVRGGAMLLERTAPNLVDGYMRFYLRTAGAAVPTGSATAAFNAKFAIPETIRAAIARQLEAVLGGI